MEKKIQKIIVNEAIIVEGRDDSAAIHRAVEAITIETHGFAMPQSMWRIIEKAYDTRGIIVFTDPDYAGEKIRRKIMERFPACKQAFLPKDKALKGEDIGVENAEPMDIIQALKDARYADGAVGKDPFTIEDLVAFGLIGKKDSKWRREKLGSLLSIGYGNGKAFLQKLNGFHISREEVLKKLKEL